MHLKSITLKGFKSFASATTFHLEPGVTCVVGPNGSGKSNVVDALAWVMGEQGAKSLRGGKMEDVIFSGSSGRAPLGRAEVSLTIDNTDGALPIEYTEVTISRTLFRNGGSEYAINGEQCRLLDIQELLSDSGIGREMHVIVGQGQLDSVLQATPEDRRGFIEEAAGVLKHRKRKEKALRKLDAMAGNLNRLQDLTAELRRQLKPLGRQAEVARRAVVIQTDVRDSRLRLYADDLLQMQGTLAAEVADETALLERRAEVETKMAVAHAREEQLELETVSDAPMLTQAQETWFKLSSLRERTAGMVSLATERVRLLAPEPEEERAGRDPELMEAEAREIRAEEFELSRQVEAEKGRLADAETARTKAEADVAAEERRIAAIERAESDRREGLARLHGQVNAARSRIEAREAELERLTETERAARERGEIAQSEFHALEVQVAGLDEGEVGLDAEYETAQRALIEADTRVEQLRREENEAERERASLAARLDALEIGLSRKDAASTVVSRQLPGVRGSLASLLHVEHGAQAAVAAALGEFANAVVVSSLDQAVDSLVFCKDDDAGRVSVLVTDEASADASSWGDAPAGTRWLIDTVSTSEDIRPTVAGLLQRVVLAPELNTARRIRREQPQLRVVTADGDYLATGIAQGGSASGQSLLEVQAAYDETAEAIAQSQHRIERAKFDLAAALDAQSSASGIVERALTQLHESDARMAAVAEQLGHLGQTARAASAEAERASASLAQIVAARDADARTLAELEARLATAEAEPVHDDAPDAREALGVLATAARAHEVEARLAVRTSEERVAASSMRAEQLERAAATERQARAAAIERRERRARELVVATAVLAGAKVMLVRVDASLNSASSERTELERVKTARDEELAKLRIELRELGADLDVLKDTVHRDEVARAEQRLRIEQLAEKVLEEFGIESEVLVAEYGPDVLVPPSPVAPGDEVDEDAPAPQPYPYVRAEQEKRLKAAEKQLALLGRVNPLALEEFQALEERLVFLTEQLDDLKRSRDDLLAIVKDVDERVQQVFSEAFADVSREFEDVFSRMFPGGDGRLILTDPSDMLNTGVDVEARPPGKKVKRLSLLSGGERSLAAVAFLVALFKARPSPFYVLDEVEAALDDVNLGRLLDIIAELRDSSQLIVITHQKRTMEIADALYGVSMRGDGVTQVIGQRLHDRDEELASV